MFKKYRQKRDFKKTSEPKGKKTKKKSKKLIFVVQEHQASHLHWDFRLEMDGVLKSWAVPKGVPQKPGIKRLAVQTEDHPLKYADFQGEIPQGEYGAGQVIIWDKGSYKLLNKEKDLIDFTLKGKKLRGNYLLFQPQSFKANNWLIFKKNDKK